MDCPSGNTGISPTSAEGPRKGSNSASDRSATGNMLTGMMHYPHGAYFPCITSRAIPRRPKVHRKGVFPKRLHNMSLVHWREPTNLCIL